MGLVAAPTPTSLYICPWGNQVLFFFFKLPGSMPVNEKLCFPYPALPLASLSLVWTSRQSV